MKAAIWAFARQLAQLTGWPLVLALFIMVVAPVVVTILIMQRRYCLRLGWGNNGRFELMPSEERKKDDG